MTTIIAILAAVLIALQSTTPLQQPAVSDAPPPPAAVRVQVLDRSGQPVVGVALRLLDRERTFVDGLTDDAGFVTLPLGTRRLDDGVFVSFGVAPSPLSQLESNSVAAAIKKTGEATRQSAFRAYYRVLSAEPLLVRGSDVVTIAIDEVLSATGTPTEVAYGGGRTGRVSPGIWRPGAAPMTIKGVERGARGAVYLLSNVAVRPIDFDESMSAGDFRLKSISLPPLGHAGSLAIEFEGEGSLEDVGLRPYLGGVALLSSDGAAIYTYLLHSPEGSPKRISVSSTDDPRREGIPPPGRYFLCAGRFTTGHHDAADLREVMRRGGKLEELGIPFVDIVEGADTKVTFDPAKARAAARKASRTLPDDPAN